MDLDLVVVFAGLLVGFVVGLTGVGGGALMTPVLVLLLGVQPLAAVSSDLVTSLAMKPFGSAVHARRGTIHPGLVGWLAVGSVPGAFCGPLLLRMIGHGPAVQQAVKYVLGVALLLAATGMVVKATLNRRDTTPETDVRSVHVKRVRTAAIGVFGGLVVGMTSVGAGSLMIVFLLALYPMLTARSLVGTDLLQALPMVAAAALGHLVLFGDLQVGLTASLILGSIPGIYVGARLSAGAPTALVRNCLVVVIFASGLKQLGAPNQLVVGFLGVAAAAGAVWGILTLHRRRRARVPGAAADHRPVTATGESVGSAADDARAGAAPRPRPATGACCPDGGRP